MSTGSLEHPAINSNTKGIIFFISDSNSVVESNKTTIYKQKTSNGIVVYSVEEEDQLVFCPNSFTTIICDPIPSKSKAHHGKPNPAGNVPSSNAANPAETA